MKFITGAVVVTFAVLATFLALRQEQSNEQLRRGLAQVEQQLHRLELSRPAQARPESMSSVEVAATAIAAGPGELGALRAEISALKASTQELTQIAKAAAVAANPTAGVPDNIVPISAWKNAGKATPEKTLETVFWAAAGGDIDTLAQTLGFTPSARVKADVWFATLSESTRRQYGSPEKLMALMMAKDAAALSGMQVLGQKEVSADDVGVRIRVANDQGKTKDDNFLLHRGTDGWRLVLPDAAVEKFARQVGGGK